MLTYVAGHLEYTPNSNGTLDLHEQPEFKRFAGAVLLKENTPHYEYPYGKPFIDWVEAEFKTTLYDVAKALSWLFGVSGKRRFFDNVGLKDNFLAR